MATGTAGTSARRYATAQTHYLRKGITFADNGDTVTIGVVPAGAVVINAMVVVSTAFNGDTTNTLDIGTSADTDGLATDIALGTAGRIVADDLATSDDLGPYASDTTLVGVVTSSASASAGAGEIIVEFVVDNDL